MNKGNYFVCGFPCALGALLRLWLTWDNTGITDKGNIFLLSQAM